MAKTMIDHRTIPWLPLSSGAIEPLYGSAEAAGADLHANLHPNESGRITIYPGERALVKTGVSIELPQGTWGDVRGRSGLALKSGIAVLAGVIDSDYRGDVGVILHNTGNKPFVIEHGDRIAQLIVQPYIRGIFEPSPILEGTERGEGGFGSTGV